jgi:hypothetical protein
MMIGFQRTQVIGAEFINDDVIRFNGIQEDHIYGMEISMEVRVGDGEILKISGNMKRYTNYVCPRAIPILQTAVGLSLRKEGWDKEVMREIGRKGCEHFAEIVIECGRCLNPAIMSRETDLALRENPDLDQGKFIDQWMAKNA